MNKNILILTECKKEGGQGHLERMLSLIEYLELPYFLVVDIDDTTKEFVEQKLLNNSIKYYQIFNHLDIKELKEFLLQSEFGLLVLDMRSPQKELYRLVNKMAIPILSFEDRNVGFEYADHYLAFFDKKYPDNIHYHPVKKAYKGLALPSSKKNILISFGARDKALLAKKALFLLDELHYLDDTQYKVTVIEGVFSDYSSFKETYQDKVFFLPYQDDLLKFMSDANIVICHLGITMIEAIMANRKVVTIQPTAYHNEIAQNILTIYNLGLTEKVKSEDLKKALEADNAEKLNYLQDNFDYSIWINQYLTSILETGKWKCPLCDTMDTQVLFRAKNYTLFKCLECKSNFSSIDERYLPNYNEEYFESHYQKVYGTSYYKDMKEIRKISQKRMLIIKNLVKSNKYNKPNSLLDIGSAFGFFLDEALRGGFIAEGVEIAEYARQSSQKDFHINIYKDLKEVENLYKTYDVVTIWFLLEHIKHIKPYLQRVSKLLNKDGLLCIAVPNGNGAFAKWNSDDYYKLRPIEHYFEPSIKAMTNLLNDFSFDVEKLNINGLHPSRVGLSDSKLHKKIQKVLKLGDTFEIYARKK